MEFLFRNVHDLHQKPTIEHKNQVLICGLHVVTFKFANFQEQLDRDKTNVIDKTYIRKTNKNIWWFPTILSSLWLLSFVLYHQL